jgi:mannosyltransferase
LWLDEAFGLSVTKAGQNVLWSGTFENHHPPLFYFLQKYWIQLGESEYILRLLSALFGTASVPLIFLLGKRIAGKGVALSAAWLSAFSPLLIWYSQEARSYSLLIFIGLAVMLAVVNLFLRPNLGWAGLFIVTMTAALYTHYGAFLLVPLQLCLIVFLKARPQCQGTSLRGGSGPPGKARGPGRRWT